MRRPIKRKAHGAIDYAFLAANLVAPSVLGLEGPARTLPYLFGAVQGALNAVTDQPLALKAVVPFRTHGTLELASGPAFVALPWLTSALAQPRARAFFGLTGVALVAVYSLTDWEA